MEAALVVVAFLAAAALLGRGFRGDSDRESAMVGSFTIPASRALPSGLSLAAVLPGQPSLRIFANRPSELVRGLPPPGDDYTLTLARGNEGRWTSVLRAPPVTSNGSVLTVTLIVPWPELASRYSSINLVVR